METPYKFMFLRKVSPLVYLLSFDEGSISLALDDVQGASMEISNSRDFRSMIAQKFLLKL